MKLEDLLAKAEQAKTLQTDLARLDAMPAADATLTIGDRPLDCDARFHLTAAELAAFIDWRRQQLHRQLRALGIEPEGEGHNEAVRQREDQFSSANQAAPSPPHRLTGEKTLSWPEAHAEAKRRLADFDPAKNLGLSRGDAIDQLAQELMADAAAPEAAEACHCGAEATVTIAGQPYCELHARGVPRPPRPSFMAGHA